MIRPVSMQDLNECAAVIRESFQTVADALGITKENAPRFTAFAVTQERLLSQLTQEKRPMFAYFDEGKIIGYYSLAFPEDGVCELNNLCVLPYCRHAGIGERLLADAQMRSVRLGCRKMVLGIVEENRRLRAWYEEKGFVHTGTKKFDFFPFTCGYMEKEL